MALFPERGSSKAGRNAAVRRRAERRGDTVADQAENAVTDGDASELVRAQTDVKGAVTDEKYGRTMTRAHRKLQRVIARAQRLADWQVGVSQWMGRTKQRSARTEIKQYQEDRFRRGAVASWVSAALVDLLLVIYVGFEMPYTYATFRIVLDVPTDVAVWNLGDWNNLAALFLAGFTSVVVLTCVGYGPRTIGFWLYPRPSDGGSRSNGPRAQLDRHISKKVGAAITLAGIVGACLVLHQISRARFHGGLFMTSTMAANTMTWMATVLPAMTFAMAILAENPHFAWVRRTAREARRQRQARRWSLAHERWLRRRYARLYGRFEARFDRIMAFLRHTGLTADWEWLDAALKGRVAPGDIPRGGHDAAALPLGRRWVHTGAAEPVMHANPWRPAHTWTRTQHLFRQLAPPAGSVLIGEWQRFCDDPLGYTALDAAQHAAIPDAQTTVDAPTGDDDRPDAPAENSPFASGSTDGNEATAADSTSNGDSAVGEPPVDGSEPTFGLPYEPVILDQPNGGTS